MYGDVPDDAPAHQPTGASARFEMSYWHGHWLDHRCTGTRARNIRARAGGDGTSDFNTPNQISGRAWGATGCASVYCQIVARLVGEFSMNLLAATARRRARILELVTRY
jgi:hypothetical protein